MSNNHLRQAPSAAQVREPRNFGKRATAARITFTRNGQERHYAISPGFAAAGLAVFCMFAVGYFSATAYLVLRDDLIGMTQARSARLLHEYEDRIASLRANLDRVTSRQLLDQQAIEAKVAELIERQEALGGRTSRIGKLIGEAQKRGLSPKAPAPAENPDPVTTGTVETPGEKSVSLDGFSLRGGTQALLADAAGIAASQEKTVPAHDIADYAQTQNLFQSVKTRIESVDREQRAMLDSLRMEASEKTAAIVTTLGSLKVKVGDDSQTGLGGPFIPLDPGIDFNAHVEALDSSLKALGTAQGLLAKVPVASPAPGSPLSSPFGARIDPFLGHQAMHSGLDFRASTGTPVHATADGKVIDAGRNGGYGNMVEIDHGNGMSTRYAHLSRISVNSGDKVSRGTKVGEVGSTGRSTGPHLHYEVRRHGHAVDPVSFLKAGRKIEKLL